VDVASISVIIAALGVIVGVIFAIVELRNINKTRQMELVMSIYSLFTTQQYMGAWEKLRTSETGNYDRYVKKHGLTEFMQVTSLFEGLGFLLHRRFLDIDLVRELMNESTKMAWEKVKPMVEDARKRLSQRKSGEYIPIFKWFEYLYNEMQKRERTLQAQQ
jgi:hypothetical protein